MMHLKNLELNFSIFLALSILRYFLPLGSGLHEGLCKELLFKGRFSVLLFRGQLPPTAQEIGWCRKFQFVSSLFQQKYLASLAASARGGILISLCFI